MVVISKVFSKPFTGGTADEKGITGKQGCQGKKSKVHNRSALRIPIRPLGRVLGAKGLIPTFMSQAQSKSIPFSVEIL
jgi:hypothetical protein